MAYQPRTKSEDKEVVEAVQAHEDKGTTPRRERRAFGSPKSRLTVPKIPSGYHLHWVNDDSGRIYDAQEGGYEFCTHEDVGLPPDVHGESRVKRRVGTNDAGEALFAYLMKIRQEWYEEDQAALSEQVDRVEEAIRSGTFEAREGDLRYVPKSGIKINSNKR